MKNFYSFFILIFFSHFGFAQLTGINPATGYKGQTYLTTTVTSSNLFLTSISANGNIYEVYLEQGVNRIPVCDRYNMFSIPNPCTVINPNTLNLVFSIPGNALTGVYDLVVTTTDVQFYGSNLQTYTLPSSFTVVPPDGYASGKVFFDKNGNGVFDVIDSGLVNQALLLQPGNQVVYTDTGGNYSYPLMNGSYTITWTGGNTHDYVRSSDSASFTFAINNANVSGLDFGGVDGIIGLSPAIAYQGEVLNSIITTLGLFTSGPYPYGNITVGYWLQQNSSYGYSIAASSFIVLDSNRAQVLTQISQTMPVGIYDLYLYVGGGAYYLYNALEVTVPPSYLTGHIYYDANNNGQFDIGENPIANQKVILNPEGSYSFSNYLGDYSMGSTLGTHTIAWTQAFSNFVITSQPAYTFTNTGNMGGFDFGLRSSLPDYTCTVQFNAASLRCYQSGTSNIVISNTSNVVAQGSLYLVGSPNVTFISANPVQSAISGDTIFWTFSNLQPLQSQTINITMMNPGPGNMVWFQSHIDVEDGFGNVQFSVDGSPYQRLILCSYDPNDKTVTPEGVDDIMHYTMMNDSLDYMIRFQNSGNDTAFTVLIRDTLDASLDMSTFELIASSHSVETQIDSNRAVTFLFNNILLPDSNMDEQGSHGFVRYRIHPKTGLPDPTRVENQAFIYFDQNPAIETNITWNTLVNQIPVGLDKPVMVDRDVYFYPNPMDKMGTFVFKNDQREKMKISLFDNSGKEVLKAETNLDKYQISGENLSSGLYFFQIINSKTGETHKGKIAIR